MTTRRGGKGSKGKGKGLYECGAEEGSEEGYEGEQEASQEEAGEVWWFSTIGYLGANPEPAWQQQRKLPAAAGRLHGCRSSPGPRLNNRFAALGEGELKDDSETAVVEPCSRAHGSAILSTRTARPLTGA